MSLIICPECKKQISQYAKQCPFCGCPSEYFVGTSEEKKQAEEPKAEEPNTVKCIKCGREVNKARTFCPTCGEKLIKPRMIEDNNSENKVDAEVEESSSGRYDPGIQVKKPDMDSEKKQEKTKAFGKMLKIEAIVIGVIAVIIIIIIIAGNLKGGKGSSKDIVNSKDDSANYSQSEFMNQCADIAYGDLSRYPDQHKDEKIKIKAEISQVITEGGATAYRAYVKESKEDILGKEWIIYDARDDKSSNIVAEDVVTVYGYFNGITTITRALTNSEDTVLSMRAKYVLFEGDQVQVDSSQTGISENVIKQAIVSSKPMKVNKNGMESKELPYTYDNVSDVRIDNSTMLENGAIQCDANYLYETSYIQLRYYVTMTFNNTDNNWSCSDITYNYFDLKSIQMPGISSQYPFDTIDVEANNVLYKNSIVGKLDTYCGDSLVSFRVKYTLSSGSLVELWLDVANGGVFTYESSRNLIDSSYEGANSTGQNTTQSASSNIQMTSSSSEDIMNLLGQSIYDVASKYGLSDEHSSDVLQYGKAGAFSVCAPWDGEDVGIIYYISIEGGNYSALGVYCGMDVDLAYSTLRNSGWEEVYENSQITFVSPDGATWISCNVDEDALVRYVFVESVNQ